MSEENVEIVRAVFEPLSRGEFSALADLPDHLELILAPEMPDAGTYRGAEARRWMVSWVESFERLTQELEKITPATARIRTRYGMPRSKRRSHLGSTHRRRQGPAPHSPPT